MNTLNDKISIKEKIKYMKCTQDLIAIYRRFRNPEYKQWLYDYNCHTMFKFQELGTLNRGRNIFLIDNISQTSGFFWSWKEVCRGLMVAERYGFTPVADWTKGPYFEEDGYGKYTNPFDYYFEPISDISVDEAKQSYNVVFYNNHTDGVNIPIYGFYEYKLMSEFVRINRKYIHIHGYLYDDLTKQIKTLLKEKKTIGVHVRGVEWGNVKNHPIPVTLHDYVERIIAACKEYHFEQIFLATDSDDTVDFFKAYFGNIVISYNDVKRSPKGSKALAIFDEHIRREHSHYWFGYEVLKDMLTLSFCHGLIAGLSYVSFAAEVFKKSRDEEYIYRNFVEQKTARTGISASKAISLMKDNKFK